MSVVRGNVVARRRRHPAHARVAALVALRSLVRHLLVVVLLLRLLLDAARRHRGNVAHGHARRRDGRHGGRGAPDVPVVAHRAVPGHRVDPVERRSVRVRHHG